MGRRDLIEGSDVCNAHSLDLQRQCFDAKSGNALIVLFAGFQQIKGSPDEKDGSQNGRLAVLTALHLQPVRLDLRCSAG